MDIYTAGPNFLPDVWVKIAEFESCNTNLGDACKVGTVFRYAAVLQIWPVSEMDLQIKDNKSSHLPSITGLDKIWYNLDFLSLLLEIQSNSIQFHILTILHGYKTVPDMSFVWTAISAEHFSSLK